MAARLAEAENKCVVVIDNTAYHSLSTDDKALMYAYYKSVDEDGEARWIIPESEIDEIFAQKHTFYILRQNRLL